MVQAEEVLGVLEPAKRIEVLFRLHGKLRVWELEAGITLEEWHDGVLGKGQAAAVDA